MLDDLMQVIETIRARIEKHDRHIEQYESRTRTTLIDPLLTALGWDVSNPSLVHIEPKTTNGWADYALLGNNGKIIAYVEAKKLHSRENALGQTVSYAVQENVTNETDIRYCASTDGDSWILYDLSDRQRAVMRTSISNPDTAKTALNLLAMWRESMADGSVALAPETLLADAATEAQESTPQPRVTGVIAATSDTDQRQPSSPPPPDWTPLTQPFEAQGKPPPSEIQFPDGDRATIRAWRGILVQLALWLHNRGEFGPQHCPMEMGTKRFLFSLDGRHRDGSTFHSLVEIGNTGIKMEAGLSAPHVVSLAQKLLKEFGHDPSQVQLKLQ